MGLEGSGRVDVVPTSILPCHLPPPSATPITHANTLAARLLVWFTVLTIQKRLRFVFDLSQSMSRGNSWDGRLDREVQTAVMLMEALVPFQHKFRTSRWSRSWQLGRRCLCVWVVKVLGLGGGDEGVRVDVCTKFCRCTCDIESEIVWGMWHWSTASPQ